MIKQLMRFLEWIDKRFPARVVITEQKFAEFEDRLKRCANDASGFNEDFHNLSDRTHAVEESVRAIKDILAKNGATVLKPEAEKLRDAFVRGEFQRGPSRAEIEARN